jgi:hypothetical protein
MNNIEKINAVAAAAVKYHDRSDYQELLSKNEIPVYDSLGEIHKFSDLDNMTLSKIDPSRTDLEILSMAQYLNQFIVDEDYVVDIDEDGILLFLQDEYMKKPKKKSESQNDLDEILGGDCE